MRCRYIRQTTWGNARGRIDGAGGSIAIVRRVVEKAPPGATAIFEPADDMPEPSTDARGLYDQRIQTAQAELAAAKPIDPRNIGFLGLPESMDYGDEA